MKSRNQSEKITDQCTKTVTGKKPYGSPRLTHYGTLVDLTRGGFGQGADVGSTEFF